MEELKNFITAKFAPNLSSNDITIEKLFGQASARQYFRARIAESGFPHLPLPPDKGAYVIMKMPQGFASPAEEVTKMAPGAPKEFPFLNIQRYLKNLELNVPEVLAVDDAQGLILLQDLGDTMLENLIQNSDHEFFVFYYKKIIDVLVELQTKTLAHRDENCVAYYRNFSEELLNWEEMIQKIERKRQKYKNNDRFSKQK